MAMPLSTQSLVGGLVGGGASAPQSLPMPQRMPQAIGPQMPQMPQMQVPGLPPQGAQPDMMMSGLQSALAMGKPVPSLESIIFGGVSKNGSFDQS